jgi:integrase
VRVGEAIGITWADVDLDRRLVHIRRTIIRVRGVGLVAKPTKSRAGLPALRLPGWLVEVLSQRRPSEVVPVQCSRMRPVAFPTG